MFRTSVFVCALLSLGLNSCNQVTVTADPTRRPDATSIATPAPTPATPTQTPAPTPTAPAVADANVRLQVPAGMTLPPHAEGLNQALVNRMIRERSTATPEMLSHTKNRNPDGSAKFLNRLILESSPYLRQHAYNPVNWFPFGEEAFELAKKLNRPVLLSVGYTTCHWCHVMARESFDDPKIATYLNQNFISIKVDREERPDVDRVYMKVVTMLTGRGGWPMTVVLTPEKTPLIGGTYFPPRDRGRRRGFMTVLKEIHGVWTKDPTQARAKGKNLAWKLSQSAIPSPPADLPDVTRIQEVARRFVRAHDASHGGFGRAPKFPTPSNLFFLLREWKRTGLPDIKVVVERTLDAMAVGGIHDHAGGGFHRYSVDTYWRVPHFEKMLYDNAQLAWLYLEASIAFKSPRFERVAHRIYRYLIRDLKSPDGGFVSGTDADSLAYNRKGHPEEGLFFVWTPSELNAVLGPEEGKRVAELFHVNSRGNFEHGHSILYLKGTWEGDPKKQLNAKQKHLASLDKLRKHRLGRPPPETDGKRVTAWNALTISAMARGSWMANRPEYLKVAQETAHWLLEKVWGPNKDGTRSLYRTYHRGMVGSHAVLRDYATLIQALLDLFEADGDPNWVKVARQLQTDQDRLFLDPSWGGYFHIPEKAGLLVRRTPDYDGAEPSGNSVTAWNLVRLNTLVPDVGYGAAADRLFRAFSRRIHGGLTYMCDALSKRLGGLRELVIMSPNGNAQDARPLLDVLTQEHIPGVVHVHLQEGQHQQKAAGQVSWVQAKVARKGKSTAYLCRDRVCKRPTSDPEVLRKLLRSP